MQVWIDKKALVYWQFERRFALASIKLAFCRCACPGSGDPGKQAIPNEAAPYPQKGEVNRSKAAKHKFCLFLLYRGEVSGVREALVGRAVLLQVFVRGRAILLYNVWN